MDNLPHVSTIPVQVSLGQIPSFPESHELIYWEKPGGFPTDLPFLTMSNAINKTPREFDKGRPQVPSLYFNISSLNAISLFVPHAGHGIPHKVWALSWIPSLLTPSPACGTKNNYSLIIWRHTSRRTKTQPHQGTCQSASSGTLANFFASGIKNIIFILFLAVGACVWVVGI